MSTLVKMPRCWKSHVASKIMFDPYNHGGNLHLLPYFECVGSESSSETELMSKLVNHPYNLIQN